MRRRLILSSVFVVLILLLADSLIRHHFHAAPIAAVLAAGAASLLFFPMMRKEDEHVRGRQLINADEVSVHIPPGEPPFQWNGLPLPQEAKSEGFLYLGQTGSGKTICLQVLLNEVLSKEPGVKAVIHDFKMNFRPLLLKLGIPDARIKILNPYDERSVAWDIQKDCIDWDSALEIAKGVIPELPHEGDSAFFRLGARFLLAGVMRFFLLEARARKKKGEAYAWTFRDVVECAKDKEIMEEMFGKYPELKTNLAYLNRDNDDILATLFQPLDELGAIPNLWKDKPTDRRISFFEWADKNNGEILILGCDPNREASLSVINRIMLNRMMKAVIQKRRAGKTEAWFFLDEFHALGRIAAFETFVSVCRDYKGCAVVATQDIAQVDALYGEKHRSTIMTNLTNKTFLKCSGDAADWAHKQIGQREVRVQQDSESIGSGHMNIGANFQHNMKALVIPTEFDLLPRFVEAGIRGYVTSSYFGDAVRLRLGKNSSVLKPIIEHGRQETDYRVESDIDKSIPQPINDGDRKRLGLKVAEPQPAQSAKPEEAESEYQRRLQEIHEGKGAPTHEDYFDAA